MMEVTWAVEAVDGGENWTTAERRLLCTESLTTKRATVCRHDKQVLHELQHIDDRYVVTSNPYVNSNITVDMRTQLAEWLYQVINDIAPLTTVLCDRSGSR